LKIGIWNLEIDNNLRFEIFNLIKFFKGRKKGDKLI